MTGTEGADAKRKLHQRTAEVPVPDWHLSASPTFDIPVAALGDVQNFIGSPPSVETDTTPGVAKFLSFAELIAFSFWAQGWALQFVGSECPAGPLSLLLFPSQGPTVYLVIALTSKHFSLRAVVEKRSKTHLSLF